jgi:hypothetical protein
MTYDKIKERLIAVLSKSDNQTAAILGDELYYEINGEQKNDPTIGWGDFFQDIVSDKSFKTEIENMHLIIILN